MISVVQTQHDLAEDQSETTLPVWERANSGHQKGIWQTEVLREMFLRKKNIRVDLFFS